MAADVDDLLELRARIESDMAVLGQVIASELARGKALALGGAILPLDGPGRTGRRAEGMGSYAEALSVPFRTPLALSFEDHRPKYEALMGSVEEAGPDPDHAARAAEWRAAHREALGTLLAYVPAGLAAAIGAMEAELEEVRG